MRKQDRYMADGSDGRNNTSHRQCCPIKHKQHDFPCVISFKQTNPHFFPERQAPGPKKFCRHSFSPATICPRSSDRLHGAGHQHDWCLQTTPRVAGINTPAGKACPCLSLPLYSKTLPADLQGKVYRTALVTKHKNARWTR